MILYGWAIHKCRQMAYLYDELDRYKIRAWITACYLILKNHRIGYVQRMSYAIAKATLAEIRKFPFRDPRWMVVSARLINAVKYQVQYSIPD